MRKIFKKAKVITALALILTMTPVTSEAAYACEGDGGYIELYNGNSAPAADFIFPYSSTDLLSDVDLEQLNDSSNTARKSKSQMAINEIFARYGYTFSGGTDTSKEAKKKFESKSWYRTAQKSCPSNNSGILQGTYMNSTEQKNIEKIVAWQKANVTSSSSARSTSSSKSSTTGYETWTIYKETTGCFGPVESISYELQWETGTVHTVVAKWDPYDTSEPTKTIRRFLVDMNRHSVVIIMDLPEGNDPLPTGVTIDLANRTYSGVY